MANMYNWEGEANLERLCIDCHHRTSQLCTECKEKELRILRTIMNKKKTEIAWLNAQCVEELSFLRLHHDIDTPTTHDSLTSTDVKIVVHDKPEDPLFAHSTILAQRSPVFSRMIGAEMKAGMNEDETGTILIVDSTRAVMSEVIMFCYTAQMSFTDEVTPEMVLAVAHKYEIWLLRRVCERKLLKTLTNDNLAERLRLAKKYEAKDLLKGAQEYFQEHFEEVFSQVLDDLISTSPIGIEIGTRPSSPPRGFRRLADFDFTDWT